MRDHSVWHPSVAKHEFEHMLQKGIIRPSSGNWCLPLHMVPKKSDGDWRPCGDYGATQQRDAPRSLPNAAHTEFHSRNRGKTIFSKIDLVRDYHQIQVEEEYIPETAICTPFGMFEFKKMPFALRNSGNTFQRFMDTITCDLHFVFDCSEIRNGAQAISDMVNYYHRFVQNMATVLQLLNS